MKVPKISLKQFRERVVRSSLFPPCGLGAAMKRMAFVQADPIRCPARAQDLILRHRVKNYKAGDLEKSYPKLDLEEYFLYAYGFLSKELWQVIHPNTNKPLTLSEKQVLKLIKELGPTHSKKLEQYVGNKRVKNYWGGFSRSAKLTMEALHDRGALRVARRENGIRMYAPSVPFTSSLTPRERFKTILLSALTSMGGTTRHFLLSELKYFTYLIESLAERKRCLQELVDAGEIQMLLVDSVEYLLTKTSKVNQVSLDEVRILAPFDPIVRDRARFEHVWGWTYRFEAYLPEKKRKLGYYAMPVLWRESVIGWANASVENKREGKYQGKCLKVRFGYVKQRPKEKAYPQAAELEVMRLATFLGLEEGAWEVEI